MHLKSIKQLGIINKCSKNKIMAKNEKFMNIKVSCLKKRP